VQGLRRDFRESAGFRSEGCAGLRHDLRESAGFHPKRLRPDLRKSAVFTLKAVQGLRRDFRESAGFRSTGCVGAQARFPSKDCAGISDNLMFFALKAVQSSGSISENLLFFARKAM